MVIGTEGFGIIKSGEWSLVTMAWNLKRMFVLSGAN